MGTYEQLGHTLYQVIWTIPGTGYDQVPGNSGDWVLGDLVRVMTGYQRSSKCGDWILREGPSKSGDQVLGYPNESSAFRRVGELKFLFYFDRTSAIAIVYGIKINYFNDLRDCRCAIEIKKNLIHLFDEMYYSYLGNRKPSHQMGYLVTRGVPIHSSYQTCRGTQ